MASIRPDAFADFDSYARRLTAAYGRLISVVGAVLVALWSFTDALIFGESAALDTLHAWRLGLVGWMLFGYGVVTWQQRGDRNPAPYLAFMLLVGSAFTYAMFGRIGGPGTPWIHVSCLLPLLTLPFLVTARARALLVLGCCATVVAGYFGPYPEHLHDPYLWVAMALLVSSSLFSFVFGEMLYRLSRSNFHQRRELHRLATVDDLTGAVARGHFYDLAEVEFARSARYQRPMSLLALDLDDFKDVNDAYGHLAGDAALRTVVELCQRSFRNVDVIGRLGGDEFVVLLPETELAEASAAAQRLRKQISEAAVSFGGKDFGVSVSIGCGERVPEDLTFDDLVARADGALYKAKRAGRARVSS